VASQNSGILDKLGALLGLGGDDSLDESQALQFIQDRWNDLKNSFIVWHQSIWQSLLFYANQSWIDWDDARKVWQPQQPTDEWVPRPRINRFSPTVDAVASNFINIPEIEAVPTPNDDPTATMVADVCSRLAKWALVKEGLKVQTGQKSDRAGIAAQLFVLAGGIFTKIRVKDIKSTRDKQQAVDTQSYTCAQCDHFEAMDPGEEAPAICPNCQSPVTPSTTKTMSPVLDEQGNPVQEELSQYEINLDIGNSLYAFPRPGATSIEDSPYLLWAERQPIDQIFFRHGFEAQPDAIWPDGYAVTYEHALNFWYTGYSNTTIQIKDSCMVLEMYVAPGKVKDFPKGFYGVVINDKPAETREWDFPEHPVTQGGYLMLPTLFFPRSIAFDLVEIQRELNAYESIIKLHAMTCAVDPIVIDANTIVNDISGRADKIIKWRPTGPNAQPPYRLAAGHLDDGIYKQRESLHAEFQNISMAVNAFRGQQEGGVTAAAAIQQLRAQAEVMFGKPSANWNNLWRETIRKYVKFMQKYMTFEELVAICGRDSEAEVRMFKGANLDKCTEWVSTRQGLPRTRDERRQEFMLLWDKGALDLTQPEVRQKVYELFGETGMMRSFNLDATNARLENEVMRTGGQVQVQPVVEDLATHLSIHKDQAKAQSFRKWPPQAQTAMFTHIMLTQQALDQQQIEQATKALAAQAAAQSIKALGVGKPASPEAASSEGAVQQQALDTASQMGQGIQGQSPDLASPTPTTKPGGSQ
jgi:hypothetical protein